MDSKIIAFIIGFVGSYFLVAAYIKANPLGSMATGLGSHL